MRYIVFILIFSFLPIKATAQLSGRTVFNGSGQPSYISVNGKSISTNMDGSFNLSFGESTNSVQIKSDYAFNLEIINIPKNIKYDIGDVFLPLKKILTKEEYSKLSGEQKANFYPIYCWTDLLGYVGNILVQPCVKILNGKSKNEICDFTWKDKKETILIDWKQITM